jgi:hypothetical protein
MLLGPAGAFGFGAGLSASLTGANDLVLAGAINAGAANLLVQGITSFRWTINLKEALLEGALGGITGYMSAGSFGIDPTVPGSSATNN